MRPCAEFGCFPLADIARSCYGQIRITVSDKTATCVLVISLLAMMPHRVNVTQDGDGAKRFMIDVSNAGLQAFRRFFDELDELIAVVDHTGRCATTNRRLQSFLGGQSQLFGELLCDVVVPEQRLLVAAFVEWYFKSRDDRVEPLVVKLDLTTAENRAVPALFRWTMLPDSQFAFVSIRVCAEATFVRDGISTEPRAQSESLTVSTSSPAHSSVQVIDVTSDRRAPSSRAARAPLSLREREIMQMILDGNRVSTIASRLFLSENTVRNHLKRVYRKLGVGSLGELRETMRSQRAS
jgi:DNA-binding CsgD family transcriptional regulator